MNRSLYVPFPQNLRVDEAKIVDYLLKIDSAHGVRYSVDGALKTPNGRTPKTRSVWILEQGSGEPRLVTAHPV